MSYSFRVSDSLNVPNRGHLLRLKLLEGSPRLKELKRGRRLLVTGPRGESAHVVVLGHATMGGRPTDARLERTRELDVVIPAAQAFVDGHRIEIGWTVAPARNDG